MGSGSASVQAYSLAFSATSGTYFDYAGVYDNLTRRKYYNGEDATKNTLAVAPASVLRVYRAAAPHVSGKMRNVSRKSARLVLHLHSWNPKSTQRLLGMILA